MSKLFVLMGMLYLFLAMVFLAAGCDRQPSPGTAPIGGPQPTTASKASSQSPSAPRASRAGSLAQIRRLLTSGDLSGAEGVLQTHLLLHPNDPEALLLGAQIDASRGQVDQAVAMLDEAAAVTTDDPQPLRIQAALLLARAERWQQAIGRLEALVRENPDSDEARRQLVEVLNRRGFRFDANQHVRVLCERHRATTDELRGLIAPARSHTGFHDKPDIENQEEIDRYGPLNVALGLFSEGDVGDALEALRRSRLLEEKHPAVVAFYGQVLLEAQQFEAFETWLEEVDPACQRYPAYWLALGGWAMRARDYRSAVRMFAEAILLEPGDLLANDRMTQALAASGNADASELFRQRSIEIDSLMRTTGQYIQDPNRGLKFIGEISQVLGRIGRPAESVEWLRIALEQMGSPPDAMRSYDAAARELQKRGVSGVHQTNLVVRLGSRPVPAGFLDRCRRPAAPIQFAGFVHAAPATSATTTLVRERRGSGGYRLSVRQRKHPGGA